MIAPTEKHMRDARLCLDYMLAEANAGKHGIRNRADILIARALANAERDGMKRAAEIAQRYADQNDAEAKKLMRRAGKLRNLGDPFGHGEMAADGCAEVTAAQHEAQSIAAAILSESGEPDQ